MIVQVNPIQMNMYLDLTQNLLIFLIHFGCGNPESCENERKLLSSIGGSSYNCAYLLNK